MNRGSLAGVAGGQKRAPDRRGQPAIVSERNKPNRELARQGPDFQGLRKTPARAIVEVGRNSLHRPSQAGMERRPINLQQDLERI
jgi:hypothetical protein